MNAAHALSRSTSSGVGLSLLVLILYVLIQQIENHLLVPKVMQKAVGLNPIISIIALLIGARLGGLVGVILSIPVATAISVVLKEIWQAKEESAQLEQAKQEENGL